MNDEFNVSKSDYYYPCYPITPIDISIENTRLPKSKTVTFTKSYILQIPYFKNRMYTCLYNIFDMKEDMKKFLDAYHLRMARNKLHRLTLGSIIVADRVKKDDTIFNMEDKVFHKACEDEYGKEQYVLKKLYDKLVVKTNGYKVKSIFIEPDNLSVDLHIKLYSAANDNCNIGFNHYRDDVYGLFTLTTITLCSGGGI